MSTQLTNTQRYQALKGIWHRMSVYVNPMSSTDHNLCNILGTRAHDNKAQRGRVCNYHKRKKEWAEYGEFVISGLD